MRIRPGSSRAGSPPHAHTRGGLREINYHVTGSSSVIGPRKFRKSRFFNRPVPNIHEMGGIAVLSTFRRRVLKRYPERSFMWSAVKRLQTKGKIANKFRVSLRTRM